MKAKEGQKKEAIQLRKEERLSIKSIAERVHVSKSTLSLWLRDYPLSEEEIRGRKSASASRPKYDPKDWRGVFPSFDHLDRRQKGMVAVSKVETAAALKGAIVSRPCTDHCAYDLILDWCGKLYRVQVKWADGESHGSHNAVSVNLSKQSRNGKVTRSGYTCEEIDVLMVYVPKIDSVLWFDAKAIEGKAKFSIRLADALNNQTKGVVMAKNFIW